MGREFESHPRLHKTKIVNEVLMSQHSSFKKSAGSTKASQTVLKRFERIDLLKKRGQWKEGQSVLGLIKTKPEL